MAVREKEKEGGEEHRRQEGVGGVEKNQKRHLSHYHIQQCLSTTLSHLLVEELSIMVGYQTVFRKHIVVHFGHYRKKLYIVDSAIKKAT